MSSRPEQEQYGAQVDRIARGAGVAFLGQGAWRFLNYATQIALAWMYGPTQLGLYVLGLTVVQMSNVLAQFGMDNGVVRYVAHYRAQEDAPRVRGTVLVAVWATFALSVVVACAIFLGAGFLAEGVFGKPSLEVVLRVFSVSLPLLTVMNMALFATQGFQNMKYTAYVQQLLQPLVHLALVGVFYIMGFQILGAVTAYAISTLVGAVLALYCLRRLLPSPLALWDQAKFEARALFAASWPLTIFSVTQRINNWTAVLVLGVFTTAGAVGIYNAAARAAEFSVLLLFAFNSIFSPMISNLYGKGRLDELGRLYRDVSRWVFTGALAVFLATVLVGRELLAILGPEFVAGYVVLIAISGAQLFNSSVGPTQRVLAMTRHQKVLMLATAGSALVGVAVNLVLVPVYGILGAAAAAAAATVLANTVTLLYVRRLLKVWPFGRRHLLPIAAGLLAAAGAYGLRLVLPPYSALSTLLFIAPIFVAAFVAILLALGLSASDRQLLAALGTAFRRSVRRA